MFGRRLQLAASVYQLNWHNIQQYVLLPTCGVQYTANVGNARVRGFELQATLRPIAGISIDATAGYTDARFTSDGHPSGGTVTISRRGDTLGGPPWTATLGMQYDTRIASKAVYVRGDIRYESANHHLLPSQDPANIAIFDPGATQPSALTEVSLRAGVRWQTFDLSLFVDNLLDAAPQLHREHMDSMTLLYTEQTLQPRTIGVTLTHRY
jgi:outer membrane receptor protein involved in Fe transport